MILVRATWWIVALLAFGFIAVGVHDRYAQLSTVSSGAGTLVGQLRSDQAHALEQAGIPITFYAVYFTALDTLAALLFASTGLVIFWFRPRDRAGLLISLFLISTGLSAIAVGMTQPRWHLAIIAVHVVWFASSMPALYLFPDGRFVPHWTRWMTAVWLIYTVVWLIFPEISPPLGFSQGFTGSELPRNLWFLLWTFSGLAAQSYRYRYVSNAMERQQIKWAEFGFCSFVILFVIGGSMITLTQLAPMGGTIMVAKFAGTSIVMLGLLLLPLSIGISILRYQLFDIDIIINRTLVYSALTASIAGLYILIVGGLGALFQMQTSLPSIVITMLLITLLFQPLRRWLQSVANRFVPAPQIMIEESVATSSSPVKQKQNIAVSESLPGTMWHGFKLMLPRIIWAITALLVLGFIAVGVSNRYTQLTTVSPDANTLVGQLQPEEAHAFEQNGLSVPVFAAYVTGLNTFIGIVFALMGLTVAWLRPKDREALLVSIVLISSAMIVAAAGTFQPQWRPVIAIVHAIFGASIVPVFYLFPDGQFVPRWTRWLTAIWLMYTVTWLIFPSLSPPFSFGRGLTGTELPRILWLLLWVCLGLIVQIYRYIKVSGPIQRQQIKWVIFGYGLGLIGLTAGIGLLTVSRLTPLNSPIIAVRLFGITILLLGLLLIPLSIGISILRYRLFDVDIIINRTLVYGALTASVVGLYVLIVGGSSIVLQAQNNLPGIIISSLLIAFLFRPLHQRLQGIADRFVPVPQSALSIKQDERETAIPKGAASPQANSETLSERRMNVKKSSLLAWGLFGIIMCVGIFGFGQWLLTGQAQGDWAKVVQTLLWNLAPAVFAFVSTLIISRQPHNKIGWLLIITPLLFMLDSAITPEISRIMTAPASPSLALFLAVWFGSIEWVFMLFPPFLIVFLFPTGAPPSPRWRWVVAYVVGLVVFIIAVTTFAKVLPPDPAMFPLTWSLVNPIGFIPQDVVKFIFSICKSLALILLAVLCIASLYVRYRRAGTVEKKQIQWLLYASGLFTLVLLTLALTQSEVLVNFLFPLVMMGIPVSIGIGILLYRLWDIDLIINRTLVYGALTVGIVTLYILLVGASSLLSQTTGNLLISLLATGLIAFLFQPLRERLQRGVNRLVYGERDDPYAVLSRLGQRLEAAYAPQSVLPTIVETVAQTLKLPYVAISLNRDGGFKMVAEFGRSTLEPISLPLIYQGEPVGQLICASRAPGEQFTAAERLLLDDLARQAGVAAHAVLLTADLQRSRERLVTAREEERRRLRRDLHDGLGPQLASFALKLETARNRMAADPQAVALLTDLSLRIQEAVADIRRLVYALRPPALDELGLVMALREGATQYNQQGMNGVNITCDAPEALPPLPAAVEVAIYRIAQEALTNVLKHAEARTCHVHLRLDESAGLLCLDVQDDGKGLSIKRRAGVGLNSMRERAEELGGTLKVNSLATGGTLLTARLPCRVSNVNTGEASQEL